MVVVENIRKYTFAKDKKEKYEASIISAIYESASNNLMHSEWYSSAQHSCNSEEVAIIQKIAEELKKNGFLVKVSVFEPNFFFDNRRVKLVINWE